MYSPDFSNDPVPGVGNVPISADGSNGTHSPDLSELSAGHANGSSYSPERLEQILKEVPFRIRVLMRLARAEFSYPTAMQHLSHPEEFIRMAQEKTLSGDPGRSPVLCVGGFGTTGQGSFNSFAEYINDQGRGPIVRVVSLAGHTGSWDAMRRATSKDMENDVERNARELYQMTGKPVSGVFLSTGGLAGLGALRREPDLYAEHNVAIGVPLELRNATWRYALTLFDRWLSRTNRPELIDGFHIANPTVSSGEIAPIFTRMPVHALVQFNRLRCSVNQEDHLAALSRRVIFLHGEEDGLADPTGSRKMVSRTGNGNLQCDPPFRKVGHNLLLSAARESVFERVSRLYSI